LKIKLKGNKINKIRKISKGVLHVMANKERLRPEQATFFRLQVWKRTEICHLFVLKDL